VLAVCPYVVGVAELYVSEGGVYLFELFPELRQLEGIFAVIVMEEEETRGMAVVFAEEGMLTLEDGFLEAL
jgi:hypothetical protein